MSSTDPNQSGRDNMTHGLPLKDQGPPRLQDREISQSRTISHPTNTGRKSKTGRRSKAGRKSKPGRKSNYGWKHCIINKCGSMLQDLNSWKQHIETFHPESVLPNSYRCMIDQCDSEFKEGDSRKEWHQHIAKNHQQSLPRRRVLKTGYGDGGRENLIPRDGTFLRRFVQRLSRNKSIQKAKESESIMLHSKNHYTKKLGPGKSTYEGEVMKLFDEQSDHVGVTVGDEIMEGCQEAAGEEHEETAVEDEEMGENGGAAAASCTEGEAVIEDDEIGQLMETDGEVFGKGEVSTKYEVMVEPM